MKSILLQEIQLPEFGTSEDLPALSAGIFESRFDRLVWFMCQKHIDFIVVFADREHCANLTYFTNLDPRFEEAMLLVDKQGSRKMLLGNECMGYTGICPIPMEFEIFQEFSLMGQDRSLSRSLKEILGDFGITKGVTIGTIYYKYHPGDTSIIEIPAYLADILKEKAGLSGAVVNAGDIVMDNEYGLRNLNSLEDLVRYEWASCRTSESVRNLIHNLKPGIREYSLAADFKSDGLPYSCHPMVSSGYKAGMGLSSPSANRVTLSDPFTCAMGVWGALTARAGMVANGPDQLDRKVAKFYESYWKAYFKTVVTWYENIGLGISAGYVTEATEAARDKTIFDFAVNTGHTLHLDEWVNSPFSKDSKVKLYSGMALQMDIIPVSKGAFVCSNMEDGVVLADEKLRDEWALRFPESYNRIQQRRILMKEKIGIQIKDEVLPLSNTPAYYAPYLLSPGKVVTVQ